VRDGRTEAQARDLVAQPAGRLDQDIRAHGRAWYRSRAQASRKPSAATVRTHPPNRDTALRRRA
jgi:hypothetical protein